MSDRMTGIHLPGIRRGAGIAEHGRKEPAEMISLLQENARQQLLEAQQILDASPQDFVVETYLGIYARRELEVIQDGKRSQTPSG